MQNRISHLSLLVEKSTDRRPWLIYKIFFAGFVTCLSVYMVAELQNVSFIHVSMSATQASISDMHYIKYLEWKDSSPERRNCELSIVS